MGMFYRAKVVFGPHGGAFSNMVASRPGTALLDMLQRMPSEEELTRSSFETSDPAKLSFAFADTACRLVSMVKITISLCMTTSLLLMLQVRTMGMCHYSIVPEFYRVRPLRGEDPLRLEDQDEAYIKVNVSRVIEKLEIIKAKQKEHP